MKEHIDEMTKVLVDYTKKNHIMASHVILEDYAETFYNAGYRKQSEGEWEGNGYLKNCSECGNVVNFNNVSQWLYKFCPNCGAKMKGGAE